MHHKFLTSILAVLALLAPPSASAVGAVDGPSSSAIESVDEVTTSSTTDVDFLSFHQQEGAPLAGAELSLSDGELVLLILGTVLLVVIIAILL